MQFVWADRNTAHIAGHGLSSADVEAVFNAPDAARVEMERPVRRIVEGTVSRKLYRVVHALTGPDKAYPITAHRVRRRRIR